MAVPPSTPGLGNKVSTGRLNKFVAMRVDPLANPQNGRFEVALQPLWHSSQKEAFLIRR